VGVRARERRPSTRPSQSWTRWGRSRTRTARSSCSSCATTSRSGRPTCRYVASPLGCADWRVAVVLGSRVGPLWRTVMGHHRGQNERRRLRPRSVRGPRLWREAVMRLEAGWERAALLLAVAAPICSPRYPQSYLPPFPGLACLTAAAPGGSVRASYTGFAQRSPTACQRPVCLVVLPQRGGTTRGTQGCLSDAVLNAGRACGRSVAALQRSSACNVASARECGVSRTWAVNAAVPASLSGCSLRAAVLTDRCSPCKAVLQAWPPRPAKRALGCCRSWQD